jgi:hypothetical protein
MKAFCVEDFVLAAHFPVMAYNRDSGQEILPQILTQAMCIADVIDERLEEIGCCIYDKKRSDYPHHNEEWLVLRRSQTTGF